MQKYVQTRQKGGGGGGVTECRRLGPNTIAEAIGKIRYRVKNSSGMLLKKTYLPFVR